jgi:hypothetical protein
MGHPSGGFLGSGGSKPEIQYRLPWLAVLADQLPDGVFLAQVQRVRFQRQAQKPYYTLTLSILEPSRFSGNLSFKPALLHSESSLEVELVPARLRLRHRTPRSRRSGRKTISGPKGSGQDQPCRLQWRFPAPPRRLRSRQPLGRTFTRKPARLPQSKSCPVPAGQLCKFDTLGPPDLLQGFAGVGGNVLVDRHEVVCFPS